MHEHGCGGVATEAGNYDTDFDMVGSQDQASLPFFRNVQSGTDCNLQPNPRLIQMLQQREQRSIASGMRHTWKWATARECVPSCQRSRVADDASVVVRSVLRAGPNRASTCVWGRVRA